MAYYPETFEYTLDPVTHLKFYKDPRLQTTYLNLRIISNLIHDTQTSARINLLTAENNIKASAVKDQTAEILGMFASKLFEGLSVVFPAGTGLAIASMIIGRMISGIITIAVKESNPNDDIQSKANEIRDGMDAIFSELKHRIDRMINDLEKQWNVPIHCEGYLDQKYKGDVYLKDFADNSDPFPDQASEQYDDMLEFLEDKCLNIIVSKLLPAKWYIKDWNTYNFKDYYTRNNGMERFYNFDHEIYNYHTDDYYWCQHFPALPGRDLGSYYEIQSSDGHESFMRWLRNMCTDKRDKARYTQYSSYYNWCETYFYRDGDKDWRAAKIHNKVLVDSNGDYAPTTLIEWLFKDDGGGNIINKRGIENRDAVYKDWGLPSL